MKVSIITINYNSSSYTIKLVESLLRYISDEIEYEIIITDNASTIKDYKYLTANIPKDNRIKIFRSNINTGFAEGNMKGYNKSRGEYLLFINNDCFCMNDIVKPLMKFMEQEESAGLLTGKIHGLDGKYTGTHKLFPSLSKSIFGSKFARMFNKNKFVSPKTQINEPTLVEVVSGALMFFKRDGFDRIKGFDEIFFLDCEEEDISKRVWNLGKKVYMIPEPEVTHAHGGSKDDSLDLRNEYYISYKKLIFKHYGFIYSSLMMIFVYLKILKLIISRRCDITLVILALKGFPDSDSLRYKQKKID